MNAKIGLCIVGCGEFARDHAREVYHRQDRVILSFASRSREKASAYARQYGGSHAFGSYEEAAKDPRVDALLFCTPHALHRENLELGAAYGKHVLMEKPIATTLRDAQVMIQKAQEAGIRFMVAENFRYMPTLRAAANLISQGAIGSLRAIHMQTIKYQRSTGWRLSRDMMGGGALIDGGIHKVTALRMLAGEPRWVSAITPAKVFPEMEGEEAISLWGIFDDGFIGTLNYSWAVVGSDAESFLAIGDGGSLQFDFYGTELQVRARDKVDRLRFDRDLSGLGPMLDAFLDLVAYGKPVPTPPEEALGDLRVVLSAYVSAGALGQPVRVPVDQNDIVKHV